MAENQGSNTASNTEGEREDGSVWMSDPRQQQQLASLLMGLRSPPAAPATIGGSASLFPPQQETVVQVGTSLSYREELARLRSQARTRVEDAIMAQPDHAKRYYLEAKEKAPKVVEEESDHLRFLKTCNYHIWKAADRVLLYWSERRDIFGPEKFYLPLNSSGNGALGEDEIQQIKVGYPAMLPASSKDNRPIMVCDRAMWLPSYTPGMLWRCIFYAFTLIAKNEEAQSEGITCLVPLNKHVKMQGNSSYAWRAMHLLSEVFPVKVDMRIISYNGLSVTALNIVRSVFFSFNAFEILKCGAHGEGLLQMLVDKVGLDPNGLPLSMGGQWDYKLSWGFLAALETERACKILLTNTHSGSLGDSRVETSPIIEDKKPAAKQRNESNKGGSQLLNENDVLLKELELAMKEFPHKQKEAYLEAKEKAPFLLEDETDPFQFTRFCNRDAKASAERLCMYWTERKKLFGSENFYRPLVLSRGALETFEAKLIQAGLPALLPPKTSSTGQKVIYIDYRQRLPCTSADQFLKALFYIMAIVANDPASQREGVLMLVYISLSRTTQSVRESDIQKSLEILAKTVPVKMHWHLLNCTSKSRFSVGTSIIERGEKLLTQHFPESQPHIHEGRTIASLGKQLENRLGLSNSGLPLDVGGTWKFEEFFKRIRKADSAKQDRYAALLRRDGSSTSASTSAETREAERKAKRRMIELIQSRRKRERKREEFESLQNESKRLKIENTDLRMERARLVALVRLAKGVLAERRLPLPTSVDEGSKDEESR